MAKTTPASRRKPVQITCYAPDWQGIYAAGTFNDWNPSATALKKMAPPMPSVVMVLIIWDQGWSYRCTRSPDVLRTSAQSLFCRTFPATIFVVVIEAVECTVQEIRRITGAGVHEAAVAPTSGTVVQVFTTSTMLHVFRGTIPLPSHRVVLNK